MPSPLAQRPANAEELDVEQQDRIPASVNAGPSHDDAKPKDAQHTVRFSSKEEEIEPAASLHTTTTSTDEKTRGQSLTEEQKEDLRNLSKSLQSNCQLQKRRMSNFVFEPVSLPASRVPSNESPGSRHGSVASRVNQSIHTPPLTPAASGGKDHLKSPPRPTAPEITPQSSGPHDASAATTATGPTRPSTAESASTRQTSVSEAQSQTEAKQKAPRIGVSDDATRSRDQSPHRGVGTPSGAGGRPYTPTGDADDPYARSKRVQQGKGSEVDSRFVVGAAKDTRRHSSLIPPRAGSPGPRSDSVDARGHDRHASTASGQRGSVAEEHSKQGAMSDLKRFFHFGHHHKRKDSTPSVKAPAPKSGTQTPPHQAPAQAVPFADDHGLESKYGKFGKVLGSGAGGSVRLMKRPSDGVTFAVKQFRDRHPYESEKEYAKKVTAEFCIGSTLHHGNIIETLDIIQERGRWYEVMEYAPYDLFNTVMTGKMSREEISCCFVQILSGVVYLHSMGLAHRDLKLDNVVVSEHGIMKIIDFGSAIVFRYPFESDIVWATGCVGSDPYLAPEVYDSKRYDPQPTDVWSLAIIFACMSLRRFPWKAPRLTDNSYKLFASTPTAGTPPARAQVNLSEANDDSKSASGRRNHTHSHTHDSSRASTQDGSKSETSTVTTRDGERSSEQQRPETIKGSWRLLRLLPRESRNIISRMLELDPKKRATLDEILADPWVDSSPVCRQIDHGQVIKATGHTHTLESSTPPDSTKK